MKIAPPLSICTSMACAAVMVVSSLLMSFPVNAEVGSSKDRGYGGGSSSGSKSSGGGYGGRDEGDRASADRSQKSSGGGRSSSSGSQRGSNNGYGGANEGSRAQADRDQRSNGGGRSSSYSGGGSGSDKDYSGNRNSPNARGGMSTKDAAGKASKDINSVKNMKTYDPITKEVRQKMGEINAMGNAANAARSANFEKALKGSVPATSGQNLKSVTNKNFGGLATDDKVTKGPTVAAAKELEDKKTKNTAVKDNAATPSAQTKQEDARNPKTDELLGPVNPVTAITTALPSLEDVLNGKVKLTAPKNPVIATGDSDRCIISSTLVDGVKKMRRLCNCNKQTYVENGVQKTVTRCY